MILAFCRVRDCEKMVGGVRIYSLGSIEDVELFVLRKMEHSHTSVSYAGEYAAV